MRFNAKEKKGKLILSSILIILMASLSSCSSPKKPSKNDILASLDSINHKNEPLTINTEELNSLFQSIPSPLEVSFLIKEVGGKYNKTYLNSVENKKKYTTGHEKAINLGVYSADLAYSNIFNKNQDGIFFLDAISELANELDLGHFFDYNTLNRLMKNDNNLDSLLLITTSNFEKINNYLQTQDRSQLSVLIIAGGWIEGLNLLCKVNKANPNDDLKERIGEQKVVLEQLLQLLEYYKHDKYVADLTNDLKALNTIFDKVKINLVEGESSYEIVDGVMKVVDNSYSEVSITEEQLSSISSSVKNIRNKVTKD